MTRQKLAQLLAKAIVKVEKFVDDVRENSKKLIDETAKFVDEVAKNVKEERKRK